ncbi:MAG: EutN/CcmL family microcompartment protein [Pseudomonadota bacterium]
MLIGQVVGTVVSTRKDEKLEGLKFLIVKVLDLEGKPSGAYVVAIDSVGAGTGEVVMYASGSSARQTSVTKDRPVDAAIMAIVDSIEISGTTRFVKT